MHWPQTPQEADQLLRHELARYSYQGPYPSPVIESITKFVFVEIEQLTSTAIDNFQKDGEYEVAAWPIHGITNGEWCYSLYTSLSRMMTDDKFELNELSLCDHQVLVLAVDSAVSIALQNIEESDPYLSDPADLWILHAWCCRLSNIPTWPDDSVPPPFAAFTEQDWTRVAGTVCSHFREGGYDDCEAMAILDHQPHWPSFQEFRKAKAFIQLWNDNTRFSRAVAESKR
jgi:hypothetical protein